MSGKYWSECCFWQKLQSCGHYKSAGDWLGGSAGVLAIGRPIFQSCELTFFFNKKVKKMSSELPAFTPIDFQTGDEKGEAGE